MMAYENWIKKLINKSMLVPQEMRSVPTLKQQQE